MGTERRATKTRPLKKFSLLGISIVASFLFVEGMLRVLPFSGRQWFPEGMYQNDADPEIAYRLAENFKADIRTLHFRFRVTTNSLGFRGPELRTDGGEPNILMVGDSFMFGQGVDDEDTVASIVARWLPYDQVINAGVYGYRPSQSYRTYQRFIASRSVHTLVIQLCHNDAMDQSAPIERAVHRGFLNPAPPTSLWGEVKNELLLRSELVARLRLNYYELKAASRPLREFIASDYESRRANELASTKALLGRWLEEAASNGTRVVIYYIPDRFQVSSDGTGEMARWRDEGESIDLDAGHRWLGSLLSAYPDVTFVDVVGKFRDHMRNDGTALYISKDGHTNATGNRLIAETLLPALVAE